MHKGGQPQLTDITRILQVCTAVQLGYSPRYFAATTIGYYPTRTIICLSIYGLPDETCVYLCMLSAVSVLL